MHERTFGPLRAAMPKPEANPKLTQAVVALTAGLVGLRVAAIAAQFGILWMKGGLITAAIAGLKGLQGAATIAELAALASDADAAAREWTLEVFDGDAAGFPAVDSVAKRVGWLDEYFSPPDFADAPVLPPVGDFAGFNCGKTFVTHLRHYALTGGGGGEWLAAQLERGPRWVEA